MGCFLADVVAGTDSWVGVNNAGRKALLGAATLLVAVIAVLGNAGAASAACETNVAGAVGVSKTFAYCGAEQSYTVPLGVTQVRVVAIGARGGNRFSLGGRGGRVESIVNVPVGTSTLYVLVGGTGEEGRFNGGGLSSAVVVPGFTPGDTSGGGASDVRYTSGDLSSRLIVGAGGGGTGPCGTNGGHGGGQPTGNGDDGGLCASDPAPAATGGTQTGGGTGAGGGDAISNGALGVGGASLHGGGGGGGLYGGGSGGLVLSSRGGAGGSSFGPTGAAFSTTTAAASVTITPFVATSTLLAAVPSTTRYGESVTFTATVTGNGSPAGGTVQFLDGATPLGAAVSLTASGQASLNTSGLTAGSHTITVNYSGSTGFGPSSGSQAYTVTKQDVTASVATSGSPSTYGQNVTFTATVTPDAGTLDGGTVQFFDGGSPIGSPVSVNTSTGQASFATSSLATGSHTITAQYSGTSNVNSDTSPDLSQTVDKASTTTAVASGSNPSVYGDSVAFTATVTPGSASLTGGTVQFSVDGTPIGGPITVNTTTGTATFSTSNLSAGAHTITGAYSGTANHTGSSGNATQTVGKRGTSTTVSTATSPSTYGEDVTLTAVVAPVGGTAALDAGSTVQFFDGATALGDPRPVDGNGKASYTTTAPLDAGDHNVTAKYSGDSNFLASDSTGAPVMQQVARGATTTTLTGPSSAVAGQTATLTAAVGSGAGTPGGEVTFRDGDAAIGTAAVGGDGRAALTTGALTVGTHRFSASYGGGANHDPSSSAAFDLAVAAAPVGQPEIVPRVGFSHRIVPLRSGRVLLALTCRAATGASCKGKVTLRVTSATSRRLKSAAAGSASYSIAAGQKRTLKMVPPKSIEKMFEKRRRAVVQVTIAQTGGKRIKKLITVVAAR